MLMKTRLPIVLGVAALAFLPTQSPACTRAVYLGPEGMTVTGRTMDWREDPLTNLYIFPRGTARRGANTDNTVFSYPRNTAPCRLPATTSASPTA